MNPTDLVPVKYFYRIRALNSNKVSSAVFFDHILASQDLGTEVADLVGIILHFSTDESERNRQKVEIARNKFLEATGMDFSEFERLGGQTIRVEGRRRPRKETRSDVSYEERVREFARSLGVER